MSSLVICFVSIMLAGVLMLSLGCWLGRVGSWKMVLALTLGMGLLISWAFLVHNPAVAIQLFPVWLLSRIEGTAAIPMFMLILGVAWARSRQPRQRRLVLFAGVIGLLYFMQGGLWMLQSTPSIGFARISHDSMVVLQSEEFTCVPAACASALNVLGFPSTEQQMADLTATRPGTGSTMFRAMDGLTQRLRSSPYRVEMLQTDLNNLSRLPMPVLTPLHMERTRMHMVTLLQVNGDHILMIDPNIGVIGMTRQQFEPIFTGQVLAFVR